MAKVVVKSKVKKAKRKFPVEIKAPEYFNSVSLGHCEVSDLGALVGKTSRLNMMYVTSSMKNQNIRLTFQVVDVASGLAKTTLKVYEYIPYYLRRFVKTGSDLVEDSFVVSSKDGVNFRVKPFLVTKMATSTMISTALRAKVKELLEQELSEKTYGEFIAAVISGKIQVSFRNDLKKVFPMKSFEFKKIELA